MTLFTTRTVRKGVFATVSTGPPCVGLTVTGLPAVDANTLSHLTGAARAPMDSDVPRSTLSSSRLARWSSGAPLRDAARRAPPAPATFMLEFAFFALATHDDEVTHVAAVHAGPHWLLCSALDPTIRLAAGVDNRTGRQFATINDAYRYARSNAPKPLKFDVR